MIKIKSFKEKFFDALELYKGRYYEIFVNPTPQEMNDAGSQSTLYTDVVGVRFIAYLKTKKVYVWSSDVVHRELMDKIIDNFPEFKEKGNALFGTAEKVSGKWDMTASDFMEGTQSYTLINKILDQDWSWVNRYIYVTDFLNHLKKDL